MNADVFRYLFNYHFYENRKLWNYCIPQLSQEQFVQKVNYSIGSVRNQIVHLMSVDESWFSELRGDKIPRSLNPVHFYDRNKIRAYWDNVEKNMRGYLADLRDDMLLEKPFDKGEDENLFVWQVLIHVVNHGTDHRSQILRTIHDFGVKTPPQDLVFYAYENL